METDRSAADTAAREHRILTRMLADCDDLCRSGDMLLSAQYRHLRGRIAALVELTIPLREAEPDA
ncbi:MAG: hypothetical protein C3F17_13590 [Bradyrhizobiaceae bacterium]|nr:MAG: hypothetical protein C3F17_13590 [Bradyrhizobiaceae bacterium]